MLRSSLIAALLALATPAAHAVVLYDGNHLPSQEGWIAYVAGSAQTQQTGFVNLDTTASRTLQAGYGLLHPALDVTGFRLDFTAQLVSEDHAINGVSDDDRAGFSVIVTDGSKLGIELAFWPDRIWAQDPGFQHGDEIMLDTTAMTSYSLTIIGNQYSLIAHVGSAVEPTLSGATLFYDADGLPGVLKNVPYRTPNILFFGDDTTSASASFNLASVSITAVPEPSSFAVFCAGLLGIGTLALCGRRRRPGPH